MACRSWSQCRRSCPPDWPPGDLRRLPLRAGRTPDLRFRLPKLRSQEPLRRPSEPALQRELRAPVEHSARLLDVHDAPADVVDVASVDVLEADRDVERLADQLRQLVDRRLDARPDVEHL